jgi:ABC-type lipoprotein release transport system permease subunit
MSARAKSRSVPLPMIAAIAARNLARHRRRSTLTASCVAASAAAVVAFMGFYRGTYDEMFFGAIIDYQTAHAQIQSPLLDPDDPSGWLEDGSTLTGYDSATAAVRALPAVKGVSPRLEFAAFAGDGVEKLPVLAAGLDFDSEREVSVFPSRVTEGDLPANRGEALVGRGFAKLFSLAPGSSFLVQATTSRGNPNLARFTVAGVFDTGLASLDSSFVATRLDDAQELCDAGDAVNRIYVKLESLEALEATMPGLASAASLCAAEARPWTRYAKAAIDHAKNEVVFYYVFLSILVIVSASAIAGTMRMAAFERVREVATMRATGWTRSDVFRLFSLESAAIGVVGSAAGALVGGALSSLLEAFPVDVSSMSETTDLPFFAMTSLSRPGDFLLATVVGVCAALVAGIGPARSAARTNIVKALQGR